MNLETINERFKSGNAIAVERADLRLAEWTAIYAVLKAVAYPAPGETGLADVAQMVRHILGMPDNPGD